MKTAKHENLNAFRFLWTASLAVQSVVLSNFGKASRQRPNHVDTSLRTDQVHGLFTYREQFAFIFRLFTILVDDSIYNSLVETPEIFDDVEIRRSCWKDDPFDPLRIQVACDQVGVMHLTVVLQ